jgi:hypothetical protein
MAGGGALTASTLTGAKFLAKPAISTATGTAGTTSAPTYATVENVASVVLMILAYILSLINPWLLVGLLALVLVALIVLLAWAVYQLWKLKRGIGRVIGLIETQPKAGLSVVAEFLVWGLGWLIWERWTRGIVRFVLWGLWLTTIFFLLPAIGTAIGTALVAIPPLAFLASLFIIGAEVTTVMIGLYVGAKSAGSLLKLFDESGELILDAVPSAPMPM